MSDDTDKQTANNGSDGRDDSGRFAPGSPGGPGRPAGSPNKVNAVLRDDILAAYEQRGGVEWLEKLSDKDFVGMLTRLLPRESAAEPASAPAPVTVRVDVVEAMREMIGGVAARALAAGGDCFSAPLGLPCDRVPVSDPDVVDVEPVSLDEG